MESSNGGKGGNRNNNNGFCGANGGNGGEDLDSGVADGQNGTDANGGFEIRPNSKSNDENGQNGDVAVGTDSNSDGGEFL